MTRRRMVPLHRGRHDEQGRRLCCHCAAPLDGRRRDWCSDECVERYLIACGDQGAARRYLWKRERGVCQACGDDTAKDDLARFRERGFDPDSVENPQGTWDADHITPIVEGGALAPENLRTLCKPCHKRETAALRKRMAARRRRAAKAGGRA